MATESQMLMLPEFVSDFRYVVSFLNAGDSKVTAGRRKWVPNFALSDYCKIEGKDRGKMFELILPCSPAYD